MKKKILLIIVMFMFITNVNALTFNVNITNIEEEGTGTLGTIKSIDQTNKTLDVLFEDIGAEVSFNVTVTNTGDRAGTLREISFVPENDKIEYTSNLPENGLAINGNDTNTVTITGRVLEGATNGTSSSQIKLSYRYDEGSCPEGEILSEDESMCLCPEGTERNENGICVEPEKEITCEKDEIYNETKKICEKKESVPSNPKTLDNIILITLLFIVSGLGIYAVMFKRLNTNKKKITVGIITGIITLGASFTVLAGVFGLDNLLSAIVNPITKSKELTLTVNEEIDLIETWDGECSLQVSELTPSNIFQGGTGTESDPYQIKTAEQLSCLAKSVNEGTSYEGQYIKQIKDIKLNDKLNENIAAETTNGLHKWIPAGYKYWDNDIDDDAIKTFAGQYDGDNHVISGLYLTNDTLPSIYAFKGLFGHATNATFKNIKLSDVYMDTRGNTGALLGFGYKDLTINNITTYGNGVFNGWEGSGVISNYDGEDVGSLRIENTTNNIKLTCGGSCSGILHRAGYVLDTTTPTVTFNNNTNNGEIKFTNSPSGAAGLFGYINTGGYIVGANNVNNGNIVGTTTSGGNVAGIIGYTYARKAVLSNSHNTKNITGFGRLGESGMLYGKLNLDEASVVTDNYNSGNFIADPNKRGDDYNYYFGGIVGYAKNTTITNSFNTGKLDANIAISHMAGIVGQGDSVTIQNCYNTGAITGRGYMAGIIGYSYSATINQCYNTGKITSMLLQGGIVGYGSGEVNVSYSYNTGEIVNNGAGNAAGICGQYCNSVTNCYNRGNITSTYQPTYIAGITGTETSTVENVYNSGKIEYTNAERYGNSGYLAGITANGGNVTNAYNYGDVTFHTITMLDAYEPNPHADGIATYASVTNSVNKGKITIKVDEPLGSQTLIQINGISYNSSTNSFNAGQIEIDDSDLVVKIANDGLNHRIQKGQITADQSSGTGNKWNTDSNGYAIGCMTLANPNSNCTLANSISIGEYTTEATPDVLSIINGNNAFEILEGDTLPTLKIFNQ